METSKNIIVILNAYAYEYVISVFDWNMAPHVEFIS